MMRFTPIVVVCLIALASLTANASIGLTLAKPTPRAVFQRGADNTGKIPVAGICEPGVTAILARVVRMPDASGDDTPWRTIAKPRADGSFSGRLIVPAGGWYRLEVCAMRHEQVVAQTAIERIGVGEVFITAGQSNAENFGHPSQRPTDDRVSAFSPATGAWQFAIDPQPGFPGAFVKFNDQGGSPWPALGDALVKALHVPIGFIMCGDGGTAVGQWLPGGGLYPRIKTAVRIFGREGVRAILWHQGESDTLAGTSEQVYAERLRQVISASREDAGWQVPWVVAIVGYFHPENAAKAPAVRAGQKAVCDGISVFDGPTTDDLLEGYRCDGIHLNEKGLREHGRRWGEKLTRIFFSGPAKR